VRELESVGVAGVQIEDQAGAKRCGHRPNKAVVETSEMVERLRAAAGARSDESFVLVARTDARAVEGLDQAVERALAYAEAGADVIFAEAPESADELRTFTAALDVPVLANITEFGKTPLYTREELGGAGVDIVLHCCSAYRAMNLAALKVFEAIRRDGTQKNVVNLMQTRDDLYKFLDYHAYEQKLDQLFVSERSGAEKEKK
jgi:methylisocitrate lyase